MSIRRRIVGIVTLMCAVFGGTRNAADAQGLSADSELGPYVHQATLARAGSPDNQFGSRVAIANDTALVAGTNLVYVFERTPGTDTWQEGAPLVPAGQAEGFGRALAFDGQTAIVGARGSAHVFRRTAPGMWQVVSVLTGNDEGAGGDFGVSVAVDGDQAIVGALGEESTVDGAAYIFSRRDGPPETWEAIAVLTPDAAGSHVGRPWGFGQTVDIDGDTAIVVEGGLTGNLFFFSRDAGSAQWGFVTRLPASGLPFGQSAALDGSTAVFGGGEIFGLAIVARRSGDQWEPEAAYPQPPCCTLFGSMTGAAISGDLIVLGLGVEGTGVHILSRNQGGQNAWGRVALLRPAPSPPQRVTLGGAAVAVSGDTVAIGGSSEHVVTILVSDTDRDGVRDGADACPRDPQNNVAGRCARSGSEYLVLDELVTQEAVSVESSGQPFIVNAAFVNRSDKRIRNPFFEIVELTGGNVLENADGGPAGNGGTLSPNVGDGVLSPGESMTVRFVIRLESREAFSFFVSVKGTAE
jgi:hypothetical protein